MSFLRIPLFTLISYYLLLHLGFCKAYQNCLVALIKITTVQSSHFFQQYRLLFCDLEFYEQPFLRLLLFVSY